MDNRLVVLMNGVVAGAVTRQANNLLRLEYEDAYRESPSATPISMSLPLAIKTHTDTARQRTVSNFLWGLLPDSEQVLERWASHYQVRSTSPFFLLGTPVGEDCAGAITFCKPEDLERHLARNGAIQWLSTVEIADQLRELRRDSATWLGRAFAGHFSLAGAQAKTALAFDGKRWGRPSGAIPTTHIIKPEGTGFADHDVNEHLSLSAASRAGIIAAHSKVMKYGSLTAIVVTRYDRAPVGDGRVSRVHQEDMCQALGIHPERKYEHQGGPGAAAISHLLRRVMPPQEADQAIWRFADGLIWSWLIAGTDAHAKNYGLLMSGRQVRLAPLYDVASILPYVGDRLPDGQVIHKRDLRSAMRVGTEYNLWPPRNTWPRAAGDLGLPPDALVERVRVLAEEAPAAFSAAASEPAIRKLGSPIVAKLVDGVADRSAECRNVL